MMQNGQLFEQAILSEPVTIETDGGSLQQTETLPTPTTMDHLPQRSPEALKKQMEGPRKGRTKLGNLREAVNPQTQELFNSIMIHNQILPTPSQSDYKGGCGTVKEEDGKLFRQSNTTGTKYGVRLDALIEYQAKKDLSQDGETQNTYSTQAGGNMVLNPQFVEMMMGLPLDYSQIEQTD
tara:strand:+ start:268 stop:807 length:540 start_codon:yes stop_codon:yes gene_type:complete